MKLRSLGLWTTALLVLSFGATPFHVPAQEAPTEAVAEATPEPKPTDVILTVDGRAITREELFKIVQAARPEAFSFVPFDQFQILEGPQLLKLGQLLGLRTKAAAAASQAGIGLPEDFDTRVERALEARAFEVYYERNVKPLIPQPTDEEVATFYEANKARFAVPEQYTFRTLFLGTYEEYTVQEGDTLRSIASKISGDESKFAQILSKETKRPRIEMADPPAPVAAPNQPTPTPDPNATPVPPRALVTGEVLMVPMGPDKLKEVEEKANALLKQVLPTDKGGEGKHFHEVAAEHSQNDNPGRLMRYRPGADRPMLQALVDAMDGMQNGEVSQPILTRHGYHIVYLDQHVEAGFQPLEAVAGTIRAELLRDNTHKTHREYIAERLAPRRAEVKIHTDKLFQPATRENEGEIVVEFGDFKMDRRTFDASFYNSENPKPAPTTTYAELGEEGLYRGLLSHPVLRQHLIRGWVQEQGLRDDPAVADLRQYIVEARLAESWLEQEARNRAEQPSEEAIKEYYEKNAALVKNPDEFDLYAVTLPIDPAVVTDNVKMEAESAKLREQLNAAVADVQSLEDFKAVARKLNTGEAATNAGAIGRKQLRDFPANVRSALGRTGKNSMTTAISTREGTSVYWVADKIEPPPPTLEEAREDITAALLKTNTGKARRELEIEMRKAVKVEAPSITPGMQAEDLIPIEEAILSTTVAPSGS